MKYIPSISLCIIFLFTSCEKEIDYIGDEMQAVIVVGGYVGAGNENILVRLSQSESVLSNEDIQYLDNAHLSLLEDDQPTTNPQALGDGWYQFDVSPQPGKEYRLDINSAGLESVSALTRVPPFPQQVTLSNINLNYAHSFPFGFRLSFIDPSGRDYYQIIVYREFGPGDANYIAGFSTNSEILRPSDAFDESEWYYYDDGFFSDDLFDGTTPSINLRTEVPEGEGALKLQVLRCTEEFYLFQKSVRLFATTSGDPFAQPVQIYSNISNGLGIFGGFSFVEIELTL